MARPDPYRAFRFVVEFDGTARGRLPVGRRPRTRTQVEPYREGGVNDFEHQFVVKTTYPPLVLKRGLTRLRALGLAPGRDRGDVRAQDHLGDAARRPRATRHGGGSAHGYPTKWAGAELDAMSDAVVTESVEFVHRGITRQ